MVFGQDKEEVSNDGIPHIVTQTGLYDDLLLIGEGIPASVTLFNSNHFDKTELAHAGTRNFRGLAPNHCLSKSSSAILMRAKLMVSANRIGN